MSKLLNVLIFFSSLRCQVIFPSSPASNKEETGICLHGWEENSGIIYSVFSNILNDLSKVSWSSSIKEEFI